MSSSSEFSALRRNEAKTTQKWGSSISRRTPSFSSSSTSSSSSFRSEEFSLPNSPSTSFGVGRGGGIPFSWETTPGIPKKQSILLKKNDSISSSSSRKLPNGKKYLPLPPPVSYNKCINHQTEHYISRRDPFYAALVECSKGDDEDNKGVFGSSSSNSWNNKPNNKSLGSRFGLLVNMSCKNSSSCVAESLVFLPTSGPRRISYDLLKKRSS